MKATEDRKNHDTVCVVGGKGKVEKGRKEGRKKTRREVASVDGVILPCGTCILPLAM